MMSFDRTFLRGPVRTRKSTYAFLSRTSIPKCPYCSEELRIKLAGRFVSEFDEEFFSMLDAFAGRMSRLARGAIRSQFGRLRENPPLVNMIVCASCDSVISAEMQKTG